MKRRLTIALLLMMMCSLFGEHRPQAVVSSEPAVELISDIFLGIDTAAMSTDERLAQGAVLPPQQGLKVCGVVPGSPAAAAGLKAGDVLLMLNGYPVDCREDLLMSMRYSRPGHIVHLSVLRAGRQLAVPVQLAARPQPVAVGRIVPHERKLTDVASLSQHQGRIACLLSLPKVDVSAVHRELDAICRLSGIDSRSGNIRLFYRNGNGYLTVTRHQGNITVSQYEEDKVQKLPLLRFGGGLPESLRAHFEKMAGNENQPVD